MTRPSRLDDAVVEEWLATHSTWRRHEDHLIRELRTRDYASGVAIVQAQVEIADRLDHHPKAIVGYREVRLELCTHDRGSLTQLDLEYAEAFDAMLTSDFANVIVE